MIYISIAGGDKTARQPITDTELNETEFDHTGSGTPATKHMCDTKREDL